MHHLIKNTFISSALLASAALAFVPAYGKSDKADEQEATLVAQEEEVHGKKRELDALKEEDKQLLDDIKKTEQELERLEHNLDTAQCLRREVKTKDSFRLVQTCFMHFFVSNYHLKIEWSCSHVLAVKISETRIK